MFFLPKMINGAWCFPKPSSFPASNEMDALEKVGSSKFGVHQILNLVVESLSRWWQLKYFWNFHPYLGKISNLTNIFQMG